MFVIEFAKGLKLIYTHTLSNHLLCSMLNLITDLSLCTPKVSELFCVHIPLCQSPASLNTVNLFKLSPSC